MNRKLFLSFLGTGRYTSCNYQWQGKEKIDNVAFIQTAMSLIFCKEFREKDKAIIFLTQQAKKANWDKLREETEKRNPGFQLTPVDIPEGHTEKEIWEIFEIVYSQLQDNDNIILDVTHAFRSIPMLGIVLMNYAKFLKNITVDGIYYGAFEVLGRPADVQNFPIEKRTAPIFDLTPFDQLQQWSAAADNFVSGGNPRKIAFLLNRWAEPKLRESKGENALARDARNLADNLEKLYKQLSTVRGKEIHDGNAFCHAKEGIEKLSVAPPIPTLSPLLNKLRGKLLGFEKNNSTNGLRAVRLCLDFGLIQQGITLLQESIVTHLTEIIPELNQLDKKHRELVSSALHIFEKNILESKWSAPACQNKALVRKILKYPETGILGPLYRNLSQLRNDINHGGYFQPMKAEDFGHKLSKYLEEAEALLMPETNRE